MQYKTTSLQKTHFVWEAPIVDGGLRAPWQVSKYVRSYNWGHNPTLVPQNREFDVVYNTDLP